MTRTHFIEMLPRLFLALATAGLPACESALEVETPSRIPAEELEVPGNAGLLVTGAVADFECALGAYVVLGGVIGDELQDATQTAARWPYDSRAQQPSDGLYSGSGCEDLGVYTPLQTARASAENVLRLLNTWTDAQVANRGFLIAKASAYAGYSLLLLGEGLCAMAVSSINADRSITYGGEIQRDSVFKLAEARFTDAITGGAADSDIMNMALVGRARARQNRGDWAGARADALQVPAAYVKNATTSSTSSRRENRVWTQSSTTRNAVSVYEPYRSMSDPRVLATNTGVPAAGSGIIIWRQDKYPLATSPIPIARGDEARLIRAEADIRLTGAADPIVADSIINSFRARGSQGPIVSTSQQMAVDSLVDQRRREFFLEGQHLGDYIRYNLPLSPAAGAPYHIGGLVYGGQRCLPLPDIETLNNPNF
jgi:starch-binding outer membrane protein, SusD/RagB family